LAGLRLLAIGGWLLASGYWFLFIYMRIYFKNRPSASAGGEHKVRPYIFLLLVVTSRVMAVG